MYKKSALEIMNAIQNSYVYSCLSIHGAVIAGRSSYADEIALTFGMDEHSQTISLGTLYRIYSEEQILDLFSHAERFLTRNLHKETFEIVKKYCMATRQIDKMKSQTWYNFSRLLRNCISHDSVFCFKKSDFIILPTVYRNVKIEACMQDSPPPVTINAHLIMALHKDMRKFVVEALD